jgi:hypothetical protein
MKADFGLDYGWRDESGREKDERTQECHDPKASGRVLQHVCRELGGAAPAIRRRR